MKIKINGSYQTEGKTQQIGLLPNKHCYASPRPSYEVRNGNIKAEFTNLENLLLTLAILLQVR